MATRRRLHDEERDTYEDVNNDGRLRDNSVADESYDQASSVRLPSLGDRRPAQLQGARRGATTGEPPTRSQFDVRGQVRHREWRGRGVRKEDCSVRYGTA